MMELEHSTFPSAQTLADFRAGRLDPQARKDVLKHLTGCAECRDALLTAAEMETEPGQVVRGIHWSRAAIAALAAAAAVAIVFLTLLPPSEMKQLARVAPNERQGLGRVTGFPYRPKAATNRGLGGNEDKEDENHYKFLEVAYKVQTPHAVGVARLEEGKQENVNKAVEVLEKARDAAPNDASVVSDLAAAYIAAGQNDKAVATAERAWQLKQTPETAWNRAAAAQSANSPQAIAYWKEYLKLDSTSAWADEARDHLDKLEHPDRL